MIPFRVIRSSVLLAGLAFALGAPLRAADGGFSTSLSHEEQTAAGLTTLTAAELAALDQLVDGDIARAKQLKTSALPGAFDQRHPAAKIAEAGVNRLTPEQLAKLNALVDEAVYNRPQPKERPRLKASDVLSEQGRLQVHGGFSFTYGWAGGGRNFRETAAWVSYYDPVTHIGLSFGYSVGSGNGLYGFYPDSDYYDDRRFYPTAASYYPASPRTTLFSLDDPADADATTSTAFKGDGASLRGPLSTYRNSRH